MKPLDTPATAASGPALAPIEAVVDAVARQDWSVCAGFLAPGRVAALRRESQRLRAGGRFRPAGVGHGAERHKAVRGDELFWIEGGAAPEAAGVMRAELEALRLAFNAACHLGLHEFEGHYATYPAGTAYARHMDGFRERNLRAVSVVLYLNEDWSPGEGGELCLYAGTGTPVTVRPAGGTLVCFLSERVPHEVLTVQRTRMSLTGWFRRRA